jgi:WG containing repeat
MPSRARGSRLIVAMQWGDDMLRLIILTFSLASSSAALAATDRANMLIEVKANGKWGVVNGNGSPVVATKYEEIYIDEDGTITANRGGATTYFDRSGRAIYSNFHSLGSADNNGWRTFENSSGLVGLVDGDGKIVLPAVYSRLSSLDLNGNYIASCRDRDSIVDRTGRQLMPQTFSYLSPLGQGGLAKATTGARKKGIIDRSGDWIIEPGAFDDFREGGGIDVIGASKVGKWGFVNLKGEWLIQPQFDNVAWSVTFGSHGAAAVQQGDKWFLVKVDGTPLTGEKFDEIYATTNANFMVTKDGKSGLIDRQGRYLIQPLFDSLGVFLSEGIATAGNDNEQFYINRTGKRIFEGRFQDISGYSGQGWAPVKSGGKWGAIDALGKWVLKPIYQCVSYCFDTAPVRSANMSSIREQNPDECEFPLIGAK